MEITNEIKAKVFAQYLGQNFKILNRIFTLTSIGEKTGINMTGHINGAQLILKPLSAISDEDAVQVCKLDHNYNAKKIQSISESGFVAFNDSIINCGVNWNKLGYRSYQYLQSKGYAMPYLNYSVEDLVKLGVYQLES